MDIVTEIIMLIRGTIGLVSTVNIIFGAKEIYSGMSNDDPRTLNKGIEKVIVGGAVILVIGGVVAYVITQAGAIRLQKEEKVKLLVEMIISGQTEWEVIEEGNAPQAVVQSRGDFLFGENGELIVNDDEVSYTGVFKVCEIDLLDLAVKEAGIHKFYHKKLEKLRINPLTFKSL